MAGGGLWAVMPLKSLRQAKPRLAPVLTPDERVGLARAMAEDVLSAVASASGLAGIMVVARDPEAGDLARRYGARILPDLANCGTTPAVEAAARHLASDGAAGMLVIPADLPLITAADVTAITAAHGAAPAVTLVRAMIDGGSNALASSPVDIIPFWYGQDSFRLHREAARARGVEPWILTLSGFERDIDRPEDLRAFVDRPSPTRSYAYLRRRGLVARLRQTPDDARVGSLPLRCRGLGGA
jgi:2-phospho-L-lactate guanylyltransferase